MAAMMNIYRVWELQRNAISARRLVPVNRIGHTEMNLGQLKILQEVITISVFVPFALLCMNENLSWNYLWAGLCLLGAVYFIFKGRP